MREAKTRISEYTSAKSHGHTVMKFLFGGIMLVGFCTVVDAAQQQSGEMEQVFLQRAAEGQQVEIALGRLAAEKASNEQVKQFGRQMIQDHQKANREVLQLASKAGIRISTQLTDRQKQTQRTFAGLSGKAFDLAYMTFMLRDHVRDVNALEQSAQTLINAEVKSWAFSILPVLKEHLERAKAVASAIGMMDTR
jgi:putative membrane protein